MSRLVECVPNFSEGNNQEVRAWGRPGQCKGLGARRAWLGVGSGDCLFWKG